MQFASFAYLAFLTAVVAVALLIAPSRSGERRLFLLAVSYLFYASLDLRFVPVLLGVTVTVYFGTAIIEKLTAPTWRRLVLATCVGLLLTTLVAFRYLPRLGNSFGSWLALLGLEPDTIVGAWFIPIGISFYSFIGIGYLVDVYRGRVSHERSFVSTALFLAFFPQVLSGPIARAPHLLPQIAHLSRPLPTQVEQGLGLLIRGFAKKLLLADVLGNYLVAPAFDQTASTSAPFLILGMYAYTLQIYFDLSGYTDLARGAGKLLGLDLTRNFNRPYLAASVSEFWTRWHISMSSFFRDYLYFALGGSKSGNVYLNLMVTFVAIGMWHGAGLNFAVYGLLHGGMVAIERYLRARRADQVSRPMPWWSRVTLTFNFVVATRILFREDSLAGALEFVNGILRWQSGQVASQAPTIALAAMLFGAALVFQPARVSVLAKALFQRSSVVAKSAALVALVYVCAAVSPSQSAFVYFRF